MQIQVPVVLLGSVAAWFTRHEAIPVIDDRYGDMHSSGLSDPDSGGDVPSPVPAVATDDRSPAPSRRP